MQRSWANRFKRSTAAKGEATVGSAKVGDEKEKKVKEDAASYTGDEVKRKELIDE